LKRVSLKATIYGQQRCIISLKIDIFRRDNDDFIGAVPMPVVKIFHFSAIFCLPERNLNRITQAPEMGEEVSGSLGT